MFELKEAVELRVDLYNSLHSCSSGELFKNKFYEHEAFSSHS